MGFWSSLVEGAKSAASFVVDHSGDIANAVGTVAKVAVTVLSVASVNSISSSSNESDTLDTELELAGGRLEETAQTELDRLDGQFPATASTEQQRSNTDSVTGIWKDPKDLTPITADITKWLAKLGIPTEQTATLASKMTETLFTPSPSSSTAKDQDGLIQTKTFTQSDAGKKWTINAAHAFYAIPLDGEGKGGKECWHGCIRVKVLLS